ncbi:Hypothetical predicted protein [Octopus vulgaris]|uniref:Uncharacterized protein n=1 Tax=Octopus vulgaris TaxID=6645 RepID=A0AA36FAX2_OCTVU|nr:Hypothetical predicted protein [Octopus vulgaris]
MALRNGSLSIVVKYFCLVMVIPTDLIQWYLFSLRILLLLLFLLTMEEEWCGSGGGTAMSSSSNSSRRKFSCGGVSDEHYEDGRVLVMITVETVARMGSDPVFEEINTDIDSKITKIEHNI